MHATKAMQAFLNSFVWLHYMHTLCYLAVLPHAAIWVTGAGGSRGLAKPVCWRLHIEELQFGNMYTPACEVTYLWHRLNVARMAGLPASLMVAACKHAAAMEEATLERIRCHSLNISNVLLALAAVGKACCRGSHIGLHATVCPQHVCRLRMFLPAGRSGCRVSFLFLVRASCS